MTTSTDGAAINQLTLSSNYFYSASSTAASASSGNAYDGTVQTVSVAGFSGTITNIVAGIFSLTPADGSTAMQFKILGSSADGQNLIFTSNTTLGSNTGPYFILANSGTPPAGAITYNSNNAYTRPAACYAEGTRILTDRGEIAIEALSVGDRVVTAAGAVKPIRWLGRRTVDCASYPRPEEVMPILVMADAFGPGCPNRDLYLSPGHAVVVTCLSPVLVPVEQFINGATIRQVSRPSVTYWHLELEEHDIILANGLASETYLDVGNRHAFENTAPWGSMMLTEVRDRAASCLPCIESGPIVEGVRDQLLRRATALGWSVAEEAAVVDFRIDGHDTNATFVEGVCRINIPAGATQLTLASPTARPQDHQPYDGDRRQLGIRLHGVAVVDEHGGRRLIAMTHPCFAEGFWDVETGTDGECRWTNGEAVIDLTGLGAAVTSLELSATLIQSVWKQPEELMLACAA